MDVSLSPEALVAAGRAMHARGWVPATSGNLSVRHPDGGLYISPSGVDKGALVASAFVHVDADGAAHGGAPSAELGLHQLVYAREPEAQIVLHAHSTNAVLLSRRVGAEVALHGFELQKALRGVVTHDIVVRIPVLDNDQDMTALAPRVSAALDHTGSRWAFVLRGHGIYAWGRTVSEAMRHLEALDVLFACALAEPA